MVLTDIPAQGIAFLATLWYVGLALRNRGIPTDSKLSGEGMYPFLQLSLTLLFPTVIRKDYVSIPIQMFIG